MAKNPSNTEHSQGTPTLPEQLVIGDSVFKLSETPELEAFVQSVMAVASTTEKNKLYSTIQGLKNQLSEKDDAIKTLEQNQVKPDNFEGTRSGQNGLAPSAKTEQQLKAIKDMQKEEKGNLTKEEVSDMIANAFNENLPKLLNNALEPIQQTLQTTREKQISDYRERRLSELGDAVIPEMVTGKSEQEIEASIAAAKDIRARYATPTPGATPPPTHTPPAQPGANPTPEDVVYRTAPPAPAVEPIAEPGRTITPTEERSINIKEMSDADFAKQRDELYAKMKGQASGYPGVGN